MNYVESLNLLGVEAKQIACIKGEGVPTTQTEGKVGCLYMNTTTGDIYKCINDTDNVYSWEIINSSSTTEPVDLSSVEKLENKTTTINDSSTDNQYPTAKAVNDKLKTKQNTLTEQNFKTVHGHSVWGSGDITIRDEEILSAIVTDTEFDKDSINPQSGKAVAGVLRDVIGEKEWEEIKVDEDDFQVGAAYRQDGTTGSRESALYCDPFEVKTGETYKISGSHNTVWALYVPFDENGNIFDEEDVDEIYKPCMGATQNVTEKTVEYTVPEGVYYLGCSTATRSSFPLIIKQLKSDFNKVSDLIDKSHEPIIDSIEVLQDETKNFSNMMLFVNNQIAPSNTWTAQNSILELNNNNVILTRDDEKAQNKIYLQFNSGECAERDKLFIKSNIKAPFSTSTNNLQTKFPGIRAFAKLGSM